MSARPSDRGAAVVTGSSRGIGAACARLLAERGWQVVVNGRDAEAVSGVVASITEAGGAAVEHVGDISTWSGAEELIGRCVDAFGGIDGLVNNAAVNDPAGWRPVWEQTESEFRTVIDVDLMGAAFCGMHAFRHMVEQGRGGSVVNMASSAQLGLPLRAALSAAKAAIVALTRSWAADGRDQGIRVNAISPVGNTGMSNPPSAAASDAAAPDPDGYLAKARAFARSVPPENNAPLVAFLLSPSSADVTGQLFHMRGRQLGVMLGPSQIQPEAIRETWTVEDVAEVFDESLRSQLRPLRIEDVTLSEGSEALEAVKGS